VLWSTKLYLCSMSRFGLGEGVHLFQPEHGLRGCEHLVTFQKCVWSAGSLPNFSHCLSVFADG